MGVAVLNHQDCWKQCLSHIKYPRACPNKQKKRVSNRTRRSPPRNQATRSPPHAAVSPKKTVDLVVEKPDLGSTGRIGPDPEMIPSQIRLPVRKSKAVPFYAGPVTMTSPPPSDVPLPAFFTTKKASLCSMPPTLPPISSGCSA